MARSSHGPAPYRRRLAAAALLLALGGLVQQPAAAQGKPADPADELSRNPLQDRKPSRGLVVDGNEEQAEQRPGPGLWERITGVARQVPLVVEEWYGWLAARMPAPVAWAVVATPPVLILSLALAWAVRRRVRERREHQAAARGPVTGVVEVPLPELLAQQPSIPPLRLNPAQRLLMRPDGDWPSLHESLLVLGVEAGVLEALRRAAPGALNAGDWAAAVSDAKLKALRPLRAGWVAAVAAQRVERWLAGHRLVARTGLRVAMPSELDPDSLGSLTLTFADGLRAPLVRTQQELLEQARALLEPVLARPENPYVLFELSRGESRPVLLGGQQEQPPAGPDKLALLLHGIPALERRLSAWEGHAEVFAELQQALDEHRGIVDRPVPAEGCGVHALSGLKRVPLPGTGMLLAAVCGAAFSPSSVLLKLSKLAGGVSSARQRRLYGRLGQAVGAALSDRSQGDGAQIVANLREILGVSLLAHERERRDQQLRELGRDFARDPIWQAGDSDPDPPDVVLVQLQRLLVDHLSRHAETALNRLLGQLQMLAYGGTKGASQKTANLRLGYAVAGLGMDLLRDTSTELLSLGREVEVTLREGSLEVEIDVDLDQR
jgi:hypothetical protein